MEDHELVKRFEFLRTEFEQNFAYLKHMEEVRLQHTTIYLTMIGALAAFVSWEQKSVPGSPRDHTLALLAVVFLCLSFYGLFFACFLRWQKDGYESYRKQNNSIREWFHKDLPVSLSLEGERQGGLWRSAFWYWYLLVVTISSLSFGLFLAFAFSPLVSGSSGGPKVIALVLWIAWIALSCLIGSRGYSQKLRDH